MKTKCARPKISEYDFLKLFFSTTIIQKQNPIIKEDELEKKLYDFYNNPDFYFLFEDICKIENIDNNHIDLSTAFQSALTYELLVLIHDNEGTKYKINLTEEEANEINSKFNSSIVIAMDKLCDELSCVETNDTALVLTKSKKSILSTHTI